MTAIVPHEQIDALAKTDLDFVNITEKIRETALADIQNNQDFDSLTDMRAKAQALGSYIAKKVQSREAKIEARNNIAEVVIRTERQIGTVIKTMQEAGELATKGGNGNNQHKNSKSDTVSLLQSHNAVEQAVSSVLTLSEVGVSRKQSQRWQTIATIPEDKFDDFVATIKENGDELTSKSAYDVGKQYKALQKVSQRKQDNPAPAPTSIEVIQGDMSDVLRKWDQSRKFDLVIADPPYNVTPWAWDQVGTREVFMGETEVWLKRCIDVCKPDYNLFWFCSPSYMADVEMLMRKMALPLQSRIIWHRRNMTKGSKARHKFIDSYEVAFHIGNREMNFPDDWSDAWFDVQTFAMPQTNFNDTKIHPTQKPLDLIKRFVEFGSYSGDMILDPFAGSGTTGHACLEVGHRQCVLIEREGEYINGINQRLAA